MMLACLAKLPRLEMVVLEELIPRMVAFQTRAGRLLLGCRGKPADCVLQ